MLTIEKVEQSIEFMDLKYEANFGDWIQNEINSKTIGIYFRNYVKDNSIHDLVIVLKWIVKKWTLKSIINLCTNILMENGNSNIYLSLKKINICQGVIYTWNSEFCSEFVYCLSKNLKQIIKLRFFANIFSNFSDEKVNDIIILLKEKKVSKEIIKLIGQRRKKLDLTDDIVMVAFNSI